MQITLIHFLEQQPSSCSINSPHSVNTTFLKCFVIDFSFQIVKCLPIHAVPTNSKRSNCPGNVHFLNPNMILCVIVSRKKDAAVQDVFLGRNKVTSQFYSLHTRTDLKYRYSISARFCLYTKAVT